MKNKTLHMIGNAHIDPVWLWRWQEGFHEVLASFRSALDRMNEDEEFIFVSSSAAFYEWVERVDPQMFAEIKQRIEEGRWEVVGGWWVQPDCTIPNGESFVRHGLYAQRYFREKFGVTAKVGYNVDSFGHNGMLPQILKKSGLDYYVFLRPSPQEKGLPSRIFWWQSDDGSRVLTFRIPFGYNTGPDDIGRVVRRTMGELKAPYDELMCFYGVGNHGGGPTKANIANIHRLNEDPEYPKLQFSSCNRFFASIEQKAQSYPIVHDELKHHANGCYSAHSGIKRWNRKAEQLLTTAEKWSTIAHLTIGQPYPTEFHRAWKNVLFNQFHDILAGTSLESAYEDARDMHGEAMTIGARALNDALQSLAWRIHIPQDESVTPIVVFNPHAWHSRVNVELEYGRLPEHPALLDNEDREIPWQLMQSEATCEGRHRLSFMADLPPLGYRVYRMADRPEAKRFESSFTVSDMMLDNGRIRLEFDPNSGYLTSLYDYQEQIEVLAGPAARPVVINDTSDTWGHQAFSFNQVVGAFEATSVKLVENGPVKAVIRVSSAYGRSELVQEFAIYADSTLIEVNTLVDWREQHKMLKIRFPAHLHLHKVTHEIPYGHIERFANGEEESVQRWVDISGASRETYERYGLSILNEDKHSADVRIQDIGLTVLRSPIYAHHIPKVPDPEGFYSFMDQGRQRFRYAIYPHAKGWEDARTVQRAAELNQRPIPLITTFHPAGTLPQVNSFASVDNDNIIINVLKRWEDGDDLILRAYETTRTATTATICLPYWGPQGAGRSFTAEFKPCEIKTFRIPRDGGEVVEVNMLEWEMA